MKAIGDIGFERAITALAAVIEACPQKGGAGRRGEIDCPGCEGGRIRYARTDDRKAHLSFACTTPGCVRGIE